jgi:Flp pilus assembly protein TadD
VIGSRPLLTGVALLCGAVVAVYAAGVDAPFYMDDRESIEENASLKSLWPIGRVLWYPAAGGRTIDGRPLLNLSFAVSRAVHGESPRAYRIGNLAIHAANAVLLWLLAARLLRAAGRDEPAGDGAFPAGGGAAFLAALIWVVHPLGVMAVTYVVQRAESLAALLMLAAVLAVVRGIQATDAGRPSRLTAVVVLAAACAGATKETAVVLPLVTLAIDRAVLGRSWAAAARHWRWHLAAAAAVPIVALMLGVWGGRGTSAGFGSAASPWRYALTQSEAIWTYLLRILWPTTLVFDYGDRMSVGLAESWPWLVATGCLIGGIGYGFLRQPAPFLGPLLFLVLLAPSSSIVPVKTQTMGEHRLYLPAAAVIVWAVWLAATAARRLRVPLPLRRIVAAAVVAALAVRTHGRNLEMCDPVAVLRGDLRYDPGNTRAMISLAGRLIGGDAAGLDEAERLLEGVAAVDPRNMDMLFNRATLRRRQGRHEAAVRDASAFIAGDAGRAAAFANRGFCLWRLGRFEAALADCEQAVALAPTTGRFWTDRGNVLLDLGRTAEARRSFERATLVDPAYAPGWWHFGIAVSQTGDPAGGLRCFDRAVAVAPDDPEARFNRGTLLAMLGRRAEARADFDAVIRLDPGHALAYLHRGRLSQEAGAAAAAEADFARHRELIGR